MCQPWNVGILRVNYLTHILALWFLWFIRRKSWVITFPGTNRYCLRFIAGLNCVRFTRIIEYQRLYHMWYGSPEKASCFASNTDNLLERVLLASSDLVVVNRNNGWFKFWQKLLMCVFTYSAISSWCFHRRLIALWAATGNFPREKPKKTSPYLGIKTYILQTYQCEL